MKDDLGFVGPADDRPWVDRVRDMVHRRGLPSEQFGFLADALLDSGALGELSTEEEVDDRVHSITCSTALGEWKATSDKNIACLEILRVLPQGDPLLADDGSTRHAAVRAKFIRICVDNEIDFAAGFEAQMGSSKHGHEKAYSGVRTGRLLTSCGLLDPSTLLNLSRLDQWADCPTLRGLGGSSADGEFECCDPTSPVFWLAVGAGPALAAFEPAMEEATDETAARLARGIGVAVKRTTLVPRDLLDQMADNRRVIQAVFKHVDARVGDDPKKACAGLRHVWMEYWHEFDGKRGLELTEGTKKRLLLAADMELGQLRLLCRSAPHSLAEFSALSEVVRAAASVLFEYSNLWSAIRPLLLAFRQLSTPAVAPDLRYWSDGRSDEETPEPWNLIPELMVNLFHSYAGREQEHDEELHELRSGFSRFCLDRLKKGKNGKHVEPDARWRYGYIRAVQELRINTEGRGHRVLQHVSSDDPSPEVRKAAKEAYIELRHGACLDGRSPRVAFLNAFWQLRQSHLLALGQGIKEEGAQRTRDEERRRTTVAERSFQAI